MMNMNGREAKGAPSADLLVCFPSRAHLTLRPKPICSPARPSESAKRHHHNHLLHPHHHHHLKKSSTRGTSGGGGGGGGSQASPMLWAKNKQMGSDNSEPTSPKVTCAGQIRVRHKANPCKSWQSVMEEIERIHKNRNKNKHNKKKSMWSESFGFKKDVLQFLTCLRNIKFDFRCFGSFPQAEVINSDDEDEDEDEDDEEDEYQDYQENQVGVREEDEGSRPIFSKWYMVLQENQNSSRSICTNQDIIKEKERHFSSDHDQDQPSPAVPPPNALLLMRCRSAPAKTWLEERQEEEKQEKQEENDDEEEEGQDREEKGKGKGKEKGDVNQEIKKGKNLKTLMEEENRNWKKENLVVMKYETDEFYQISSDIVRETWVVGGMKDLLSRSKSWKR